ncbi:MAG: DUF924 domain-containing protein [Desulfuromonadales bacterium]|nr:DUF924 domain-containing protein [Desulfuromonadales bacterium]
MATMEEVLQFWFGDLGPDEPVPVHWSQFWFGGAAEVDAAIRQRFAATVTTALEGDFEEWRQTPRGTLALILLLDQFPRNIYRGTAEAYAGDSRALQLCREGCRRGFDRRLTTVRRAFFYLPLEHAEERQAQIDSVAAFKALLAQAPPALEETCRGFLDYAQRHRDIIERFDRFPHRNAVLGRISTQEEELFLREPGSRF